MNSNPDERTVEEESSENCLYLNIYAPCEQSRREKLPVLFWIHGGASRRGSGGTYFYGPEYFLENKIVLVTINYRLIPFGFLSLESASMPGNQGLKDQTLALRPKIQPCRPQYQPCRPNCSPKALRS